MSIIHVKLVLENLKKQTVTDNPEKIYINYIHQYFFKMSTLPPTAENDGSMCIGFLSPHNLYKAA